MKRIPVFIFVSIFLISSLGYSTEDMPRGIRIDGIAYDPAGESIVIVNDQMHREGDTVGGYTIKKISQSSITVDKDGVTYHMPYDPPDTKGFARTWKNWKRKISDWFKKRGKQSFTTMDVEGKDPNYVKAIAYYREGKWKQAMRYAQIAVESGNLSSAEIQEMSSIVKECREELKYTDKTGKFDSLYAQGMDALKQGDQHRLEARQYEQLRHHRKPKLTKMYRKALDCYKRALDCFKQAKNYATTKPMKFDCEKKIEMLEIRMDYIKREQSLWH